MTRLILRLDLLVWGSGITADIHLWAGLHDTCKASVWCSAGSGTELSAWSGTRSYSENVYVFLLQSIYFCSYSSSLPHIALFSSGIFWPNSKPLWEIKDLRATKIFKKREFGPKSNKVVQKVCKNIPLF